MGWVCSEGDGGRAGGNVREDEERVTQSGCRHKMFVVQKRERDKKRK